MNAIAENSSCAPTTESAAITIPLGFCVTPEQFEQLAHAEQLARLELTKAGELIVMSPTGGTAGRKNSRLIQRLRNWADLDGTGEVFDSELVSPSERCDPADFKSARERAPRLRNQRYEDLQAKMQEYIDNGVRLGWLIEPSAKTVEIYRPQTLVEKLNNPQAVSGENILPGFSLDLTDIFAH